MRQSRSEKLETIRLVEDSELLVTATVRERGIPRSTFYGWYRFSGHLRSRSRRSRSVAVFRRFLYRTEYCVEHRHATRAGEAPVEATRISTPQFDITTSPSDREVVPGNRFSLDLNVQPGPGMHVYGPGAIGYRVIALRVDPQPFVRVRPMEYLESAT